jgi:rubrerythrin
MGKMTQANLEAAFAGESQAHMKYTIFADRAERQGFPEVARLFRAVAYAEQVHAANHLRELGGIGSTADNLAAAVGGENHEVTEMYPAFDAVAKLEEEKGAIRSIRYALEAEKIHEGLYRSASESVTGGKDIDAAPVYVCTVCGHTSVGHAPDKCPVCGLLGEKFKQF